MVSKSIESAQRQVESMHFAARKNVLEYDDVMNLQRKAIYEERNAILDGKDMAGRMPRHHLATPSTTWWGRCCPANPAERRLGRAKRRRHVGGQHDRLRAGSRWPRSTTTTTREEVAEAMTAYLERHLRATRPRTLGHAMMESLSAQVMLRIIDTQAGWQHLQEMDYLKTGIGLRAFGQRDPLVEYKNEAYAAFQRLTRVHVRRLPAHACCASRWRAGQARRPRGPCRRAGRPA